MADGPVVALIERYVKGRVARREVTAVSAKAMRYGLMSFAVSYGQRPVAVMGRADIDRWLVSIRDLRPASRRSYLSTMKCFTRWLLREQKIKRDPCADVGRIRQPKRMPVVFEPAEVTLILDQCPDARARLIVLLIFQLGLRCVSVSRLELGDIGSTHITVDGKGHDEYRIFLVAEVRAALNAYLAAERGGTQGPLIVNRMRPGTPLHPKTIGRLVRDWIIAAGLKRYAYDGRTAHGGRRSAATHMLDNGVAIQRVARVLGHADLSTVELYAKDRDSAVDEAVEGRWYGRLPVAEIADVG